MQSLSEKLSQFYKSIKPPKNLPEGIEILFPQNDKQVIKLVEKFLHKYYNDDHPRRLMLGINPGRFGAGITGVNFTSPKQLKEDCGIDHHLKLSSELSAEFIYEVVNAYGGPKQFYQDWFIGAVCPLGFVQRTPNRIHKVQSGSVPSAGRDKATQLLKRVEKNINYYDDKKLMEAVTPFIVNSIKKQLLFGFQTDRCICIGGEKNFKYLSALNNKYRWFEEIIPLPHPRFILQYRRKQKDKYIHQYLSALKLAG